MLRVSYISTSHHIISPHLNVRVSCDSDMLMYVSIWDVESNGAFISAFGPNIMSKSEEMLYFSFE